MTTRLGPVMVDLAGCTLNDEERTLLAHPAVGGVILFARNYENPARLAALTDAIRAVRDPHPLIAVDQEGGRVQRFRTGFTRLPPLARCGAWYRADPSAALAATRDLAWLMATELRAVGVDFSFAPVLDIERGVSQVIGDRAFGDNAALVGALGAAWLDGLHAAGFAGCGKHFPGHGAVVADSHLELPRDPRPLAAIEAEDLAPFRLMIDHGLEAIMPAHVVYEQVDPRPAGFSSFWLRDLLRGRLGFDGLIFSDDLDMAAAAAGGGYGERALAALAAGCDLALICNNRRAAWEILDAVGDWYEAAAEQRLLRLFPRPGLGGDDPDRRAAALAACERLHALA